MLLLLVAGDEAPVYIFLLLHNNHFSEVEGKRNGIEVRVLLDSESVKVEHSSCW